MQPIVHSLFFLLCLASGSLLSQATATATSDSGGAYPVFEAAGFGYEGPDSSSPGCTDGVAGNHSSFGDHVTQAADAELGQNVFVFHSHIDEDSDRCTENGDAIDRIRTEIKGGPAGNSDPQLEHNYGDTSYYRWQFRLAADYIGASSFCHLFQLKAQGGDDSGFPVLTLTARDNRVEFLHNGGDTNPDGTLGRLARAPLTEFLGKWVEVYLRLTHTDSGEIDLSVRDVATGTTLITFGGSGIDLFRGESGDAVINRPKWGIYRALNPTAGIKDEMVCFANFCSSESSAEACPSIITVTPPKTGAVTRALPVDASENVPLYMPVVWDAEPQATSYKVYFGTTPTPPLVETVAGTTYSPTLLAGTTYYYQIGAVNAEGETKNAVQSFTTLTNPDDGVWEVARGHARPNVEAPQFFEFDTNLSGTAEIDSTGPIPGEPGNNAHTFFSTEGSTGNHRWRYRPEVDEELTVVIRLAPIAGQNNITYIDFRSLGYRQKLNIKRSSVRFEQAPGTSAEQTLDFNGFWDDEAFHVIRLAFARGTDNASMVTTLYLDESTTPFASFASTTATGSNYMDIGRAGGDDFGASFDFVAVNPTGPFAPASGGTSTPPEDLLPSEEPPVSWLGELTADPIGKRGYRLEWTVADFSVEGDHLTVEGSTDGSEFQPLKSMALQQNRSDERKFTYVDANPILGTVAYRIQLTAIDGTTSFSNVVTVGAESRALLPENFAASRPAVSDLSLSPNPAASELRISGFETGKLTYRIASPVGQIVASGILAEEDRLLDVTSLTAGSYFLQLRGETGAVVTRPFFKR